MTTVRKKKPKPTPPPKIEPGALIAMLDNDIRALFPTQILGFPGAYSQFDKTVYLLLIDGVPSPDGQPPPPRLDLAKACAIALKWFEGQRTKGDDVVVWRKYPTIVYDPPRLRIRCHTMTKAALIKHLKAKA